jgi:predicted DNA-binding transcriptional regulator AlpA
MTTYDSTVAVQELPAGGWVAWRICDVAEALGCSRRHVENLLARDPSFPRPRRLGRLSRWDPSTIMRWVADAATREAEADAARPKARRRGNGRIR